MKQGMMRRAVPITTEFQHREIDGKRYFEGYFAVFGARYNLWDNNYETIDEGAFDLATDTDVRALLNHDSTLVLGRTTAGTLELSVDKHGLWGRIEINENDQDAVNGYARVQRRDVTQCSFGFEILDEERIVNDDGSTAWHIRKVKLWEVSVVTFPAYEDTTVQARKSELATVNKRKNEAWKADMLKRLKGEQNA